MKDRIQQFIDYKGITPGDLAAVLEVQRSNISHILNGRNKPGAAFIEKFLLSYPDLNARWLLTGEGEMIISAEAGGERTPSHEAQQQDLNSDTPKIKPNNTQNQEPSKNTFAESDNVEKVILLNSDGTFSVYKTRK